MSEAVMNSENTTEPSATEPQSAVPAGSEATPAATEPVTLSAAEYAALKARADEASTNYDKLLRAHAEMDNLRKRLSKEKQDAIAYANESLLQDILPVLDNLELALMSTQQTDNVQAIKDGLKMVCQQFLMMLREQGLEEVDALNKPFDYNLHEALSEVETADHPEGTVIQQTRKGYKLKGRLLRPANVVIAKAVTSGSTSSGQS